MHSFFVRILLSITILASLMSQVPLILEMGYDVYFKAVWFVPFIFFLFHHSKTMTEPPMMFMYIAVGTMTAYCAIMDAVSLEKYLNVDIYNMWISMMVAATSYSIYRHYGSDGMLRDIAVCSIISSLVLCYVLQTQYFVDYDLMDRVFAFNAKNSMGQILLNCAIVIVLFPISRIMLFRFVQWFTIVPIVVMLFMLKSRSTLVGFFFVVFYMIVQSRDKRIRWLTLAVALAFIIYLLSNAEAFNTIVYGILMAGRDVNDVNEVSSERIQTISEALEIIPDNILFGVGNKYVDCMPISMMLQFGFIGFVIVITYIGILFRKIVKLDLKNNIHLATFLIFVAMVLNSLFEAWPPFGPGVKCFMLWMMLGFSLALESKPNRQGIAKPLYE